MYRALQRLGTIARTAPSLTSELATQNARQIARRTGGQVARQVTRPQTLPGARRQLTLAPGRSSHQAAPTFFIPEPLSPAIPSAESLRQRCVSTQAAVIDLPNLLSKSMIAVSSFCLTAAAWCYHQLTGQLLTNDVIVDRKGVRYLALHTNSDFVDPETGQVLKPYQYLIRRLFGDSEAYSWQEDYYILFPVLTNESGEFYIDYANPVSASMVETFPETNNENLTLLATAKEYEGRGLGTLQLLRVAGHCADSGRDFTGDPIDSAVSFYSHVLKQISSVVGGEPLGQLFDLDSYRTSEDMEAMHDISIPNRALRVLAKFAKIRESLRASPTASQETISEHPDLRKLHQKLKSSLLDPAKVLSVHHGLEHLFERIAEMEELTARASKINISGKSSLSMNP